MEPPPERMVLVLRVLVGWGVPGQAFAVPVGQPETPVALAPFGASDLSEKAAQRALAAAASAWFEMGWRRATKQALRMPPPEIASPTSASAD